MTGRVKLVGQALAVAIVGALFVLLAWKLIRDDDGGVAVELARGATPPAPEFTLPRLDRDGTLTLSSLKGKAVVLNFWASWCVPCKAEAPRLQEASERWRGEGVVVVGVDAQDFRSDARAFMRRYGITYPVVFDGKGSLLGRYGVTGFPETFFVDRSGKLVALRIQGEVSEAELERGIRLALGRRS